MPENELGQTVYVVCNRKAKAMIITGYSVDHWILGDPEDPDVMLTVDLQIPKQTEHEVWNIIQENISAELGEIRSQIEELENKDIELVRQLNVVEQNVIRTYPLNLQLWCDKYKITTYLETFGTSKKQYQAVMYEHLTALGDQEQAARTELQQLNDYQITGTSRLAFFLSKR